MTPLELDPFITKLRKNLGSAERRDDGHVSFTTLFVRDLADLLEDARDALAGQDQAEAAIGLRGLIPSHERIGEKYRNIPQPPTALEKLIFDTTVVDPEQGEALRAFMQGYASVGRHD